MFSDIVIVGGGLSGLFAADYIKSNHPAIKLVLLEAKENLGGKVDSTLIDDIAFDTGGHWISPNHKELLRYVKHFDLFLDEQYYHIDDDYHNGGLCESINYRNPSLKWEDVSKIDIFFDEIKEFCELIDIKSPWCHSKALNWDNLTVKDYLMQRDLPKRSFKEISLYLESLFATSLDKISFLFLLYGLKSGKELETNENQKYYIREGAQKLVYEMVKSLRNREVNIICNTTVKNINSVNIENFSTTHCTPYSHEILLEVITETHLVYRTNRVIVAMSPKLSVSNISFDPPLPLPKQRLYEAMEGGYACKVIILYSRPFWLSNGFNRDDDHIYDRKHFTELGPIQNLFHHQTYLKAFNHSFATASSSADYLATPPCTGPHTLPPRPPIPMFGLVGLITGPAAQDFIAWTEEERRTKVLNQIFAMYGVEEALYPLHYLEKLWPLDSHCSGCYAAVLPAGGVYSAYGMHLRTPFGGIYWASADIAVEHYGYMEGALQSGRQAARDLLSSLP